MEHLYFVVHTHWDREWYQSFQRMRARLLTMTDKMLALLESGRASIALFLNFAPGRGLAMLLQLGARR